MESMQGSFNHEAEKANTELKKVSNQTPLTMEDIMRAKLGDIPETGDLTVRFKKTINIRQYESEVIEASMSLKCENNLTGAERMLALALMQAQLEYEAFCSLAFKGVINQTELNQRKDELEKAVNSIRAKAEKVLGRDVSNII